MGLTPPTVGSVQKPNTLVIPRCSRIAGTCVAPKMQNKVCGSKMEMWLDNVKMHRFPWQSISMWFSRCGCGKPMKINGYLESYW